MNVLNFIKISTILQLISSYMLRVLMTHDQGARNYNMVLY
jgi:hypothetical protein